MTFGNEQPTYGFAPTPQQSGKYYDDQAKALEDRGDPKGAKKLYETAAETYASCGDDANADIARKKAESL